MQKHFVTFLSPGTFVHETTTREVEAWDVDKAVAMAREINERHGATPFAFEFSTRTRGDADFDSKESKRSCRYYLGGTIETLEDVERRNDPQESILLFNMKANGWDRIVVNTNSWKIAQPLNDGDVVLDFEPVAATASNPS